MNGNGYKQTEIGIIPLEWEATSLKQIGTLKDGDWILNRDYTKSGDGVRLLQVGDVGELRFIGKSNRWVSDRRVEELGCTLLETGDILISRMPEPIGRACILPNLPYRCITAVDVTIFRPQDAERDFVTFALDSSFTLKQAEQLAYGVTRKRITRRNLEQIQIPLPPLPEQKKIAAVLSKIQQAIKVQEKIIERTKELKKALMAKLFTEGLHGEELKETETGFMPKSWEVVTIGSLAVDGIMNGAFVKNPRWGTGTRFLNVVDTYRSEQVNVDSLMRLEVSDGFRTNYALENKDVLFVRSSLKEEGIGQACFVDGLAELVIYDCHLMKLSPKLEMVDPFYLVLYCLTEQGKKGLIAKSNKTTMTTINQTGLSDFPLPLAPLAEQKEIVHVAESLNSKLSIHQSKLTKWQGLFSAMLHQLMTGQIRVNNLELPFVGEQTRAAHVQA